ncbi:DMT family transporter [Peribacillus frigoritolerans]|uniref:DMT family transporter n=1 Tax=Peribacillus frigoritolerans TaxID=450367 RepID=UPI002EA70495|nr:DMT family transporter [Peribacillus frigoritolerans]
MKKNIYGSFLVLLSASCFGVMGILAKYAYAADVSIGTLLFFRFFFAAILFWSWILYKKTPFKLPIKEIITLFIMGTGGYALMAIFLFTSYSLLPLSLSTTVFYLYPVFVIILTSFLSKQALEVSKLVAILFLLIGLYFMLGADISKLNLVGLLCALGCAILYAFYIVQTEKIQSYMNTFLISAYVTSFATLALFIFSIYRQDFTIEINSSGWFAIFGIAFFSTFLAILTFSIGIKYIGSSKAAQLSIFEPVFTLMLSSFLLHDFLGQTQLLGITLMLIGILFTNITWQKVQPIMRSQKSISQNIKTRRDNSI